MHEAAHAWSALKLGDDTAWLGGQVTLDPTPHIKRSPVGMIVVPILSYLLGGWMIGWASAPYNAQWALQYPRRAAWMSLAGPASNALLVIAAALLIRIGMAADIFMAPASLGPTQMTEAVGPGIAVFLAKMLSLVFSLNLLLCTFNLLPFPPMDGSAILMGFSANGPAGKLFQLLRHPSLNVLGLIVAWRVFNAIYPTIQLTAAHLLYPGINYHTL